MADIAIDPQAMRRLQGLRLTLVGPQAPPAGGMANQTRQLAELLQAAGTDVVLVPTNAAYWPAWIGRVPMLRAVARLVFYVAALWRHMHHRQLVHVMANSGWAWHLFAMPAIWIARARGLPVLVNYRGGEAASFLERAAKGVRRTMRRASVLAVPSGFLREIFERHGMHAEVLPNIVDLRRYRPDTARLGPSADRAHIVVTRNLEPLYDNATALRAFARVLARHPGARLTLAGSGPQEARLRALAHELGVQAQVRFAGRLDRDEVASLLRQADINLNPSLADNMPNSVLEALASGVPVVSTEVGGVAHVVQHGQTALLVAPGDAQAMADAMLRLLDDAALWLRLRDAGLREVQRYTWEQVGPVLAALYARSVGTAR